MIENPKNVRLLLLYKKIQIQRNEKLKNFIKKQRTVFVRLKFAWNVNKLLIDMPIIFDEYHSQCDIVVVVVVDVSLYNQRVSYQLLQKKQLNIDTDSHNCTCVCVCVQTHKSLARQFVNIHKKRNSKTNSNNNVYHDINMWGLYTIAPPFHVIHLLLLHSNRLTALILRRDSFVWKCASFKWFFFLSSLSWKRNKKYLLLFWWSSGGYKFTLFIWLYLCSNEKEHEFDYYAVAEFSMIVWTVKIDLYPN